MIYLDDDVTCFDLEAALPLLSEQRREQVLRFYHERDRKLCAMAYLLLCKGLRAEYGVVEPPTFVYGDHGKPFIEGRPDIHFNFSHCREGAICVLGDRPVGVDIEGLRAYDDGLVRYTMNEREQQAIFGSARPDHEFIRLWTMKEAVLKYSGQGITTDLKSVLDDFTEPIITVSDPAGRYVYSVVGMGQELLLGAE